MSQSKRLIFNTLATFAQQVVTVAIAIVSTPLIFRALGETDWGVYGVLGAGLSLLWVFTDALIASASRHLAFELGAGDEGAAKRVFNQVLCLFALTAVILYSVGWFLGPWILQGLTIPESRERAAWWTYQLLLLNLTVGLLQTPFFAVFMARQALVQDAIFRVLNSLCMLGAAIILTFSSWDRLILYAVLTAIIQTSLAFTQVLVALYRFDEARPRPGLITLRGTLPLISFAGWTFVGSVAWRLRMQGAIVVLNLFFGPIVNGAYNLSIQVSGIQRQVRDAVTRAALPHMTQNAGAGQRNTMKQMVLITSKYGSLLMVMMLGPLILEGDTLLRWWLGKQAPPYTYEFIVWMSLSMLIDALTTGHWMAASAEGRVAKLVSVALIPLLAPIPIAVMVFWWTSAGPVMLVWLVVGGTLGTMLVQIAVAGPISGVTFRQWLARVVWPVGAVFAASLGAAWLLQAVLEEGVERVLYVVGLFLALAAALSWFCALRANERAQFLQLVRRRRPSIAG